MGVLYDIYCIPKRPFSVDWATILHKLIDDQLVRPPFWAGHAVRTVVTTSFLRAPDLPPAEAMVGNEPDRPRAFPGADEALAYIEREDSAMVALEVPASSLRREPQNFHPTSSYLGLYRFRSGYSLTLGEPEDWTGEGGNREARWRGEVFEFLWISGKNAPLPEDFERSPIHLAIDQLWPGCLVLGDERL